jgi:hypothetical protein
VGRVDLPAGLHVGGLALAGDSVAWSGCRPCAGTARDTTEVYLARLGGRPRVVARTRLGGSTSVVGLDGRTLVWLDTAAVRAAPAGSPQWDLRALDLGSGRTWTVGRGGGPAGTHRTPVAFLRDGAVTWQVFDLVTSRGPVRSADLRTRRVSTVTPDLPGLLRGVAPRGLVLVAKDGEVRTVVPDAPVPADAYLVRTDARRAAPGPPLPLTDGHDVDDATVGPRDLVWWTRQGDGESVLARPVGGGPARRLFSGPVLGVAAGDGFAAWTTREPAPVAQVGAGGRVLTLPDVPSESGVLATDGRRVALVTVPRRGADGPLGIAVLAVARGG